MRCGEEIQVEGGCRLREYYDFDIKRTVGKDASFERPVETDKFGILWSRRVANGVSGNVVSFGFVGSRLVENLNHCGSV